jgi:hypothetical protein
VDEPWVYTYEVEGWVAENEEEIVTLGLGGLIFNPVDGSLYRLNEAMFGNPEHKSNIKRTIKVRIEVIDES